MLDGLTIDSIKIISQYKARVSFVLIFETLGESTQIAQMFGAFYAILHFSRGHFVDNKKYGCS